MFISLEIAQRDMCVVLITMFKLPCGNVSLVVGTRKPLARYASVVDAGLSILKKMNTFNAV